MTLLSSWGEQLNKQHPLPEYPRMQMQRSSFINLNGTWDFQVTKGEEPIIAMAWQRVVVPFPIGSALSGSKYVVLPDDTLWYRTIFQMEDRQHQVLLHFGAVDQVCTIYLNGKEVGFHEGGYTPFEFDVTDFLQDRNELLVKVKDYSNLGPYVFGKQRLDHGGMWYTPTAGIWQTVWMEELPEHAVRSLTITPNFDEKTVQIQLEGEFDQAVITVFSDKKLVYRSITGLKEHTITLSKVHPWTCEDPFLYDLYIETEDDTIKSYFAMRKFSKEKDENGVVRFCLNNEPLFLSGLLDQGYSVDGLLTFPSDEAIIYELTKIKDLGFNLLRKHVKQESDRWYYHCDRLGILVMQDMPNGGWPYDNHTSVLPTIGFRTLSDQAYQHYGREDEEGRTMYYQELEQMIHSLYNHPCIFAWVPFNEGWGQFDSVKVTDFIRTLDSTRLIDSTSGWQDQGAGDFNSRHCYFRPFKAPKLDDRILLLSEFGGFSYLVEGHSNPKEVYGYKKLEDEKSWNEAIFQEYHNSVVKNLPKGLCGCILTQVSDIEDEINGLFTADRAEIKINEKRIRRMNHRLIRKGK